MDATPSPAHAPGATQITVADFLEAGRGRLGLELVSGGEHLSHVIEEPVLNRSGLALTGFFESFAWRRVQLVGNAERAYLESLDSATRQRRFADMFARRAYCVVFTHGQRPGADVVAAAEAAGAVLLVTPHDTLGFMAEATAVLVKLAAPRQVVYGTMVEVYGLGVLIQGAPALGKSETALGLIKRGASLVADDLTCLWKDVFSGNLYGSARPAAAGFMEIRGLGIINIQRLFGVSALRRTKRLQLVVTFRPFDEVRAEIDRIGEKRLTCSLLGTDVPNVVIPVSEARDLVNLVETAVQQQKLSQAGYDPAGELSEHLRLRAEEVEGAARDRSK